MKSENDLAEVVGLLTVIAEQCGEQVSPQRLAFVASEIMRHGADKCLTALQTMLRSVRRFPTVLEVEKEMGVVSVLDHENIARLLIASILGGVRKYGQVLPGNATKMRKIEATIGESAVKLVGKVGGWNAMVDRLSREDEATVSAQMRELAVSAMIAGDSFSAFSIPTSDEAKDLCDEIEVAARQALAPPAIAPPKLDPAVTRQKLDDLRRDLRKAMAKPDRPELDVDSMTRMIGGPPYE